MVQLQCGLWGGGPVIPRDRRAVWLGVTVVTAAVTLLRVGPWMSRSIRAHLDHLEAREEAVVSGRANLALLPALEDSARGLREALIASATRMLNATSTADAAAVLTTVLTQLATASGLTVLEAVPVPDSATAGSLRRSSARLTLEGDIRGLSEYLLRLQRQDVALVPFRVQVASVEGNTGPGPERLRIEMRLWAWFLAPGDSA